MKSQVFNLNYVFLIHDHKFFRKGNNLTIEDILFFDFNRMCISSFVYNKLE